MSYYAVHTPLQTKSVEIAHFKSRTNIQETQQNPVYAAMIKGVDESIGRVMATLNDLKLAENTLVVFMSDNGGLLGNGTWTKGLITANLTLRGGKGSCYEGGMRVPAIFCMERKN